MTTTLRILLTLALAAFLVLPGFGGDGGENGGGTGIWILPRASSCVTASPGGVPRDQRCFASLQSDVVMQVSSDCGSVGATSLDDLTCVPSALPVLGNSIRVPASLLQMLAASHAKATVVVMDSQGIGYTLLVTASTTSGALIRVY